MIPPCPVVGNEVRVSVDKSSLYENILKPLIDKLSIKGHQRTRVIRYAEKWIGAKQIQQ